MNVTVSFAGLIRSTWVVPKIVDERVYMCATLHTRSWHSLFTTTYVVVVSFFIASFLGFQRPSNISSGSQPDFRRLTFSCDVYHGGLRRENYTFEIRRVPKNVPWKDERRIRTFSNTHSLHGKKAKKTTWNSWKEEKLRFYISWTLKNSTRWN